ncbi:30S ribosomal protein S12 methylthiotransferase RimO [Eubacterium sp. AB3007]|uniref:30S ribosomal protein S12 methylthiotransferase RimO n=1 Tax=Eubacterium sp. AB3007 TaxID=1392487 RepID=UPI000489E3B5|nr:30S ribosomal protein S12 methylthiotransferase RimO [Eubacterium sp. AB3007]MBQ1471174.1 30S ribosomal protein S12 methylthiotransferase RimO [Eubacterium sp.]
MKVHFDTLGCPKNFDDSQVAMARLEAAGHSIVSSPEASDVIVVNTCGFIEDAKKESIEEIFHMSEYKQAGKKLIVSGCLVQRYADELFENMPEVDGFIGVNDYDKLPELLDSLSKDTAQRFKQRGGCDLTGIEDVMRKIPENPYSAYLRIAEGCNNRCAYCVIPQIRGPYRSRPMENILEEARKLADAGCKELILIAQDVTCYGMDVHGKSTLPQLLTRLCAIEGIRWIRLMYCYEDRITDELIETMAREEKICHYIDIPLQHCSDTMLRRMNRRSTSESIRQTLRKLREAMPDIHIRTTLIVGFPGETEEEFSELLDLVEEQKFARLGAFTYSLEEGTPAAEMENQIPEEEKQARLDAVMLRQMDISLANNQQKIGQVLEVLIDEQDEDGAYIGRTRYDAPEIDNTVIFTSEKKHHTGDIVQVRVLDAFDYDLEGREEVL